MLFEQTFIDESATTENGRIRSSTVAATPLVDGRKHR